MTQKKKEKNVCSFVKTYVWAINSNAGDTEFLGLLQLFEKLQT